MNASQNPKANRKPTNVSLDAALLKDAREFNVNVSRACEQGLAEAVRKHKWAQWQQDNREAIEAYNRYVATHKLAAELLYGDDDGAV